MSKIGLTGVIGSGKTTVSRLFAKLGAKTFNCDQKIHQFYQNPNHPVYKKVVEAFPDVQLEGYISRDKLAQVVFNDSEKLEKLEQIVHPEIIRLLNKWFESKEKQEAYLAEVPLLFEKNLEGLFDKTILMEVKKDILVERLKKNYKFSDKEIAKRLSLYLSKEKKLEKADFILENNLGLENLEKEVSLLWQKIDKT
ncbi:MAG: dephospho-CoA kinase [Candidatus Omnitrophica bacterium]|nr:dephospho-CoA kinase [Candidatus Omnitrophota bacterium]MCF7893974.1 dephospho-CoA kinase [Candidatus Omnitrophota bacterium]